MQLREKARMFGLGLDAAEEAGRVRLEILPAYDLEADHVADLLVRDIERRGVRRLVIDSAGELEHSMTSDAPQGPIPRRPGRLSPRTGASRPTSHSTSTPSSGRRSSSRGRRCRFWPRICSSCATPSTTASSIGCSRSSRCASRTTIGPCTSSRCAPATASSCSAGRPRPSDCSRGSRSPPGTARRLAPRPSRTSEHGDHPDRRR